MASLQAYLPFFHDSGDAVVDPADVTISVYSLMGITPVVDSAPTEKLFDGLPIFVPRTPLKLTPGVYTFLWMEDNVVLQTYSRNVVAESGHVYPGFTGTARTHSSAEDAADLVLHAYFSGPLQAPVVLDPQLVPDTSLYEATYSAPDAPGAYLLVWYRTGAEEVIAVSTLEVRSAGKFQRVTFLITTLSPPREFLGDTRVSFLHVETGSKLPQMVSNFNGEIHTHLPVGTYVVTISKPGLVFTTNNFEVEVVESPLLTISLISDYAAEPDDDVHSVAVCHLFIRLADSRGMPLAGLPVLLEPHYMGRVSGGVLEIARPMTVYTNSVGKAEFTLAQGMKVHVSVPYSSLRRLITVPSGEAAEQPVDVLDLLSDNPTDFLSVSAYKPGTAVRTDL